jgi:hypothetical protein
VREVYGLLRSRVYIDRLYLSRETGRGCYKKRKYKTVTVSLVTYIHIKIISEKDFLVGKTKNILVTANQKEIS